jgi:hypothetical protein
MGTTKIAKVLVMVATAPLISCGAGLAQMSSGQVGCPPDDITISDKSPGFGTSSWTATCNGRVYFCSAVSGSAPWGGGIQVSCRRSGGADDESATAAPTHRESPSEDRRERERPAKANDPPTGAGGFTLGSSMTAASQLCTGAGKEWTASEKDLYRCTGTPTDVGFPASARLRFCGAELCSVTLILTLDEQDKAGWVQRYLSLRTALVKKYGAVTGRTEDVPEACAHAIADCVARGTTTFESKWVWDEGASIRLVLGRFEGITGVAIAYRSKPETLKPKLDGL